MEDQQQQATAAAPVKDSKARTPEEQQRRRKLETLRLSRARIVQLMNASQDSRYTEMLQRTLTDLDRQIAALKG